MLPSPLSLDGWLDFNRSKWKLEPLRLRLSEQGKDLPMVEICLYLDSRGRICQPRLNPYLPVRFSPTPTGHLPKIYRQWLTLAELLTQEFYGRGLRGTICFPPDIVDTRQFQWSGYLVEPRYTFVLEIPYDPERADHAVRKQIAKATRSGYRCERTRVFHDVYVCLKDTEDRQKFSYEIAPQDLELAGKLLNDDVLRCYACYAPNGKVAAVRVVLMCPKGAAIDWLAGTSGDHLTSGATQLLISYILEDLHKAGAVLFDYCGANMKSVAASKATWGGQLQPYYAISAPNLRGLARVICLRTRAYGRWMEW